MTFDQAQKSGIVNMVEHDAPLKAAPVDAEWAKRANEALAGIDYAMDWKNNSPSAEQFAVGLATARQFVIDAKNTHPQ